MKVVGRSHLPVKPALGSGSRSKRSKFLFGFGSLATGAANESAGKPLYSTGQCDWFDIGPYRMGSCARYVACPRLLRNQALWWLQLRWVRYLPVAPLFRRN